MKKSLILTLVALFAIGILAIGCAKEETNIIDTAADTVLSETTATYATDTVMDTTMTDTTMTDTTMTDTTVPAATTTTPAQ